MLVSLKKTVLAGLLFSSSLAFAGNLPERLVVSLSLDKISALTSLEDQKDLIKEALRIEGREVENIQKLGRRYFVVSLKEGEGKNLGISSLVNRLSSVPLFKTVEHDLEIKPMALSPETRFTDFNDSGWADMKSVYGTGYDSQIDSVAKHYASFGNQAVIAVIDTGYVPHPDFTNKVIDEANFHNRVGSAPGTSALEKNVCDTGDPVTFYHGTAVASQIVGVADNSSGVVGVTSNSKVQMIKGLDACGGSISNVVDSFYWLLDQASVVPNVVNLSLGTQADSSDAPCPSFVQDGIDDLNSAGVIVVAASGNEGSLNLSIPAACEGVVAVGALKKDGDITSFSNIGSKMYSTIGDFVPVATPGANSFGFISGTSNASPLVAGLIALATSNEQNISYSDVVSAFESSSEDFSSGVCATTGNPCGKKVKAEDFVLALSPSIRTSVTNNPPWINQDVGDLPDEQPPSTGNSNGVVSEDTGIPLGRTVSRVFSASEFDLKIISGAVQFRGPSSSSLEPTEANTAAKFSTSRSGTFGYQVYGSNSNGFGTSTVYNVLFGVSQEGSIVRLTDPSPYVPEETASPQDNIPTRGNPIVSGGGGGGSFGLSMLILLAPLLAIRKFLTSRVKSA